MVKYEFYARTPDGFEYKVEVKGETSIEVISTAQIIWDDLKKAGHILPARP